MPKKSEKVVNIVQIAAEAGVSCASVSRVMNGRSGVSEKTRNRIMPFLRKYNYISESHLTPPRRLAVLYAEHQFCPYLENALNGIFAYSDANNIIPTLVFLDSGSKRTVLEQIRDYQCSGVIIIPVIEAGRLRELEHSNLPVIIMDSPPLYAGSGYIGHDSYTGAAMATRHLIELGHRKIGYVEFPVSSFDQFQRVQAYKNVMAEFGVARQESWHIVGERADCASIARMACRATGVLLDRHPELTALLLTNDDMALGAICAAAERQLRIPEELSIVGFDNHPETEFYNPPLTTVHHPLQEMGYFAAQEIDHYWHSNGQVPLPQRIFPTRLIVRRSTAPARQS